MPPLTADSDQEEDDGTAPRLVVVCAVPPSGTQQR